MRPYVMNNELLAGALSDLRCELKGKIDDEQNELLYECISRIFSRTDVELERNRLKQELKSAEEIAGRMNALEAERDKLRGALESCGAYRTELVNQVNALEAERDRYKAALERIVSGFPNDEGNGILWNVYPNAYTGDPEQVQENPYEVARAMLAIATQALKGGGDE